MPDRSNFARQCANLWKVKEEFFNYLTKHQDKYIQIVDSMPLEVCKFPRAKRARLFKGQASYGKWFNTKPDILPKQIVKKLNGMCRLKVAHGVKN